ncbi:hypothetical protein N657DRAFT_551291, partial [Parathielavia appendiculata]
MAINGTSAVPTLTAHGLERMTTMPVAVAIAVILAALAFGALSPRLDPREPPLVKPGIPLVGHIIGLMRHQAQYHINLQRSTRKPIATLPMLTGKMYAVWDPYLTAAGLRNKSLSSTPHILTATPVLSQTSQTTTALLHGPLGEPLVDKMMLKAIPASLKGPPIHRLNTTALTSLAAQLTTLAPSPTTPATVPNAWLWLRRLLTTATTAALYGPHDPF